MIALNVYWILLALGLFFAALAGVLTGEGPKVCKTLASVCFLVDVILAVLVVAG